MEFLKAEIERKKRQMQEKGVMAGPDKKYFKRGDLAEKQREEYLAKHSPKSDAATKSEEMKVNTEKEIKSKKIEEGLNAIPTLPKSEIVKRLRDRCQPILLFGETLINACERLKQVEMDAPDAVGVQASGSTNDFKEARETVDQEHMQQMLHSQEIKRQEGTNISNLELNFYEPSYTYDELLSRATDLGNSKMEEDDMVLQEFILVLMKKWRLEICNRNQTMKASVQDKMEAARYSQTRSYLKPLLRMVKKHTVSDDIRDSLVQMVKHALQRDYITSHERYMEMAIGNAPWPIGVTNAGIHARPARENIHSKHVAHVLNDETQRKFIQGLKRLLTKAQQYYPTDPSRSVDFVKDDIKEKNICESISSDSVKADSDPVVEKS